MATRELTGSAREEDERLIDRWIEPNPHHPGADEAWVAGYGVPVWALAAHTAIVNGDREQVARDYALPREAVDAALAYYARHKTIIDSRNAVNASRL